MFKRIAADLGDKNIPRVLVQQVIPNQLKTLYYREESSNPLDKTLEIWNCEEHKFYLVEGDNSKGEWSVNNLQLIGEYDSVDRAVAEVRANYTLVQDENPEPISTAAGVKIKRLIKKN